MTGAKDTSTGSWMEHKDAPSRTAQERRAARSQMPTLPDGVDSDSARPGLAALSGGTFDVPEPRLELVVEDEEDSVETARRPFSGYWFEGASDELDGADPEEADLEDLMPTQRPEELGATPVASDYGGPEFATTPRYEDDPIIEAAELDAELHLESPPASEPTSPSAPSLELLRASVRPTPTEDPEVRAEVSDLDEELEGLLASRGLVLGAPPADLHCGGLFGVSPGPEPLLDAVDDDDTNPEVPSARRQSERVHAPLGTGVQESVAPPPVSVTVRPPSSETEPTSAPRPGGLPREAWWSAALVVGAAAAAAVLVLIASRFLDGRSADPVTAIEVPEAPVAAAPTPAVEVADSDVSNDQDTDEAARGAADTAESMPAEAVPAEPTSFDSASSGAASPLVSESRDTSGSIAERMRRAAGEESGETRPDQTRTETEPSEVAPESDAESMGDDDTPVRVGFDRAAANAALSDVAARASACRQPGDPSGTARVVVTFSPSSGRATQATVTGKPFEGTATGGCIARIASRATVPPYSGSYVSVGKTVVIQ